MARTDRAAAVPGQADAGSGRAELVETGKRTARRIMRAVPSARGTVTAWSTRVRDAD